jgi:phospholipid/cholesterol/gamma-HCH transport system permease protein
MRSLLEALGSGVLAFYRFNVELALLVSESIGFVLTGAFSLRHSLFQMSEIGVNSLPIVMLTVGFSGMVLAFYTATEGLKLGATQYIGGLVALTMFRELAPVIAAVVVAARAGSAMAAELGSMAVTEQVDALRALATSPTEYLVVPRVLASVVMLPVLGLFADIVGVAAGYFIAVQVGVPPSGYIESVRRLASVQDMVVGLMKMVPFALIISLVSCHQGLSTQGGAQGVGRMTTSAVVLSIVLIYAADFLMSLVLPLP